MQAFRDETNTRQPVFPDRGVVSTVQCSSMLPCSYCCGFCFYQRAAAWLHAVMPPLCLGTGPAIPLPLLLPMHQYMPLLLLLLLLPSQPLLAQLQHRCQLPLQCRCCPCCQCHSCCGCRCGCCFWCCSTALAAAVSDTLHILPALEHHCESNRCVLQ